MQKKTLSFLAFTFLVQIVLPGAISQATAQAEKVSYPAMAPLDQYLIPDGDSEIALARSAAPASISDGAEVMVLGPKGYTTAVKGTNGFLCIVERSWGAATDEPEFWNPRVRAPICFNPASRKELCAHLPDEDQTSAGRKIEDGNRQDDRIGTGQEGTARAGAGSDVLHDVEAAVLKRPRHELASPCDVCCSRRRVEKLGRPICQAHRLWRQMILKNG